MFAGGSPLGIALVHGVSPSEAHFSVWKVVDAVCNAHSLKIDFPTSHADQKTSLKNFKKSVRLVLTIAVIASTAC